MALAGDVGRETAAIAVKHKAIVMRALVIGWLLQRLVAGLRRPAMVLMSGWAWKVDLWLTQHLSIFVPISFLFVEGVGATLTGWVIARLHRPYSMAVAFVYVASLLLFESAGFINSFQRGVAAFGPVGLAINALFPFVVVPAAILTGALSSASPRQAN